jgi:hypothetical protein
MNFITWNCAYSLYPRATFEHRQSLAVNVAADQSKALRKYVERGYAILSSFSAPTGSLYFQNVLRWTDDAHSWALNLRDPCVASPPPLTASSRPIQHDPITQNSWKLCAAENKTVDVMYEVAWTSVLRYGYTVGDSGYLRTLLQFFIKQGRLQFNYFPEYKDKTRDHPEVQKYWTW